MTTTSPDEPFNFTAAADALEKHSKGMKWTAAVVGGVGAAGLVLAAILGWKSTGDGLDRLEASDYSNQVLIFELVRTAAGAALLAAFVWGTLNLARAALDQSTRYEKRFIAGHFLVYVLRKFESEIKDGDINLPDVMSVFKAWSDSVDSAFTHVKFGSRKNQALSFAATKDGFAVATGGADLPAVPKESRTTTPS